MKAGKHPNALRLSKDRKVTPLAYQNPGGEWVAKFPNAFGLPAGLSCPGATSFCVDCYGTAAERRTGTAALLRHNLELLQKAKTVDNMAELLRTMMQLYEVEADRWELEPRDRIFRIHWDGDFFSIDYACAWGKVIHDTPNVNYWAYTRSFAEPVNVVPWLESLPNLMLYLSVDEHNVDAARDVVRLYPGLPLALCGEDYTATKRIGAQLAGHRAGQRPVMIPVPCPENSRKLDLVVEPGEGACVNCRLCPDQRRDVMFATSHQWHAGSAVERDGHRDGYCDHCGCLIIGDATYCGRTCQVAALHRRQLLERRAVNPRKASITSSAI